MSLPLRAISTPLLTLRCTVHRQRQYLHVFNGHTVLEYLTGEVPRTHRDLVSHTEVAEALSGLDSEFLTQLQHILQEHNSLVQIARDDDARYNALVCDATGSRQRTTQFTLRPGDQVSYDDDKT